MFSDGKAAVLSDDDLTETTFIQVDLAGALLNDVDRSGTTFQDTDLEGVDLRKAVNWKDVSSVEGTNIFGVRNAPDGFVASALEHGAINEAGALSDLWQQAQAFKAKEQGAA